MRITINVEVGKKLKNISGYTYEASLSNTKFHTKLPVSLALGHRPCDGHTHTQTFLVFVFLATLAI